eukprot:SAG11_NODE_590_length_8314_cov_44.934388_8_plen_105_part_00
MALNIFEPRYRCLPDTKNTTITQLYHFAGDERAQLCTVSYDGSALRLMVRRCLDGEKKFGMTGIGSSEDGQAELGTEVEIVESRQLHDGRFHLQVKCMHARCMH